MLLRNLRFLRLVLSLEAFLFLLDLGFHLCFELLNLFNFARKVCLQSLLRLLESFLLLLMQCQLCLQLVDLTLEVWSCCGLGGGLLGKLPLQVLNLLGQLG